MGLGNLQHWRVAFWGIARADLVARFDPHLSFLIDRHWKPYNVSNLTSVKKMQEFFN
jgi:hypothetical protein